MTAKPRSDSARTAGPKFGCLIFKIQTDPLPPFAAARAAPTSHAMLGTMQGNLG